MKKVYSNLLNKSYFHLKNKYLKHMESYARRVFSHNCKLKFDRAFALEAQFMLCIYVNGRFSCQLSIRTSIKLQFCSISNTFLIRLAISHGRKLLQIQIYPPLKIVIKKKTSSATIHFFHQMARICHKSDTNIYCDDGSYAGRSKVLDGKTVYIDKKKKNLLLILIFVFQGDC